MNNSWYPLFLNLTGQSAIVIGGGQVATRKVRTLLKAHARVTVIAPRVSAALAQLSKRCQVTLRQRAYRAGDLAGATLVVAATDDPVINRRICADAKRKKLLVNCAAPPAAGNFIVPASIAKGGLTIAISTAGASPALAKRIRRDLEQFLRAEYGGIARRLGKLRATRPRHD